MQATSLHFVDTVYSADSIEWCPFEGYQDVFVCGTYQIIKSDPEPISVSVGGEDASEDEEDVVPSRPTQRVGRLLVYQVMEDQTSLVEIQRIETAAILDTKWSPRLDDGRPVLVVADAKGCITMYVMDAGSRKLEQKQRIEVEDESVLCLSLDFSHRLDSSEPSSIITSLSNGSLAHLVPNESDYEVETSWKAHDFEPWITSFDNWDTNTVWSGGDDCKLKRWDIRETFRPSMVNKNFEAGVTTISSSPHTPHLLAVGSYDESLRLFDARSPLQPLACIPLGGGIWRTRFHPSPERKGDILNACMHDHFKIIRLDESFVSPGSDGFRTVEEGGAEVIKTFEGHTSLAYGADWSRLPERDGSSLLATCSFYDHAMHLWRG
ncbi:hypothetical protein IAU60_000929 [Kwoniella sp. DSM 27419]